MEHLFVGLKQFRLVLVVKKFLLVLIIGLEELVLVSELVLKVDYIHLVGVHVIELEMLLTRKEFIRIMSVILVDVPIHEPGELLHPIRGLVHGDPLLVVSQLPL